MNEIVYSVYCTTETALSKLKKAQVPVTHCIRHGAEFEFSCKEHYSQKVEKEFAHSSYKLTVKKQSRRYVVKKFLLTRVGVLLGAFFFAVSIFLSQSFVLRIDVYGSGDYLKNEVLSVLYSNGIRKYSVYKGTNTASLTAHLLSLPNVTFCSVKKSGVIFYVDIEADTSENIKIDYGALLSDTVGTVRKIVLICGTTHFKEGDKIGIGDEIIQPYMTVNEQNLDCLAVGYCVISATEKISVEVACDSSEEMQKAVASVALYAEKYTVLDVLFRALDDKNYYDITYEYSKTLSINMQ